MKHMHRFLYVLRKWLRKHHNILGFIGGVGIVLFWYGIWEIAAYHVTPLQALLLGMVILWISGLFVFELIGSEALEEDLQKEDKVLKKIEEIIEEIKKIK